jgi:predicted GTPase
MYNEKATFSIIGKPNNGKSTIISTLTFDDRIEIADEIGTTKKSTKYSYRYNEQEVCTYFDTPGFEDAENIYLYIKKQKELVPSINQILENFIKEYSDDYSTAKDREILKAIVQSDFLVFVINISDRFNINVIGYELEIFKELKKRTVILFNQVNKNKDYSSEWKNELKKYDLVNIHKIDPLNTKRSNIIHILESLYSVDSDIYDKQQLDNVIMAYRKHYNQNLDRSSELISKYLREVLQIEIKTTRKDFDLGKGYELIKKEINKKEKDIQKKLAHLWGYYEVKVEDKRENYDNAINKKISLSKKEKAVAAAIIGASIVGTTTGILSGGLGAPAGAGIGLVGGALLGYFSDGKLYESSLFKKDVKITVSKKDIDLSIILITRILEFIKTIISHGHANRNRVIVDKIEKRNFTNEEIRFLTEIHSSFVKDKNSNEYILRLQELILKILKDEIK